MAIRNLFFKIIFNYRIIVYDVVLISVIQQHESATSAFSYSVLSDPM